MDFKIGNIGPLGPSERKNKKKASDQGGEFGKLLGGEESKSSSGVQGTQPMGMLEGLIAIQQVEDNVWKQEKAQKDGKQMLDYLDEIRLSLLSGQLSTMTVRNLMHTLENADFDVEDPRLSRILNDIEIRAAVELAKLENAKAAQSRFD